MRIVVTQKHIDAGMRKDCERCPVALALIDAHVSFYGISSTRVHSFKEPRILELPDVATAFIHRFDDGEAVEPFEFELPSKQKPKES